MTIDDIALTLHYGLGTKGIVHLLSVMGGAKDIYLATESELVEKCDIKVDLAREILSKRYHREAEKEMRFLEKHSLTAVSSTDEEYPVLLREAPDYPHVIYIDGNKDVLRGRMLSMVGTRTMTPYGQRMCDVLVGRIAELVPDTVIVSGLAFGVDANCHKAALKYNLPTVAVVANSFPGVTPTQNSNLAKDIIASGGAVITELHSNTKQNGAYYLPRNRIVAGMSGGTVLVESPLNGGSLSTADMAFGYDRIVMAVPGRAGDRCSEGANRLIKDRRAAMVCSGDDIVHELGWDIEVPGKVPTRSTHSQLLSDAEKALIGCFREGESLHIDILATRSGMSVSELSAMLMKLEIGGVIRSLRGKIFEIV